MGRFMVVTFLLLGWAFFELSGGTDFEPPVAEERPLSVLLEQVAAEEEGQVARASTSPATSPIITAGDVTVRRVPLTRARLEQPQTGRETQTGFETQTGLEALTVAENAAPLASEAAPEDLRTVSASRVNMRGGPGTTFDVLDTLSRGAEARVLEDPGNGWVQIRVSDTGQVGWMAARLMTPVN
ncbi:MAG: SH3 domain-containing protein [Pseudomonadota bacterium]